MKKLQIEIKMKQVVKDLKATVMKVEIKKYNWYKWKRKEWGHMIYLIQVEHGTDRNSKILWTRYKNK